MATSAATCLANTSRRSGTDPAVDTQEDTSNTVSTERRRHPRVARPLEGTWKGASGTGACRIADISLGGCFIQSLAMPAVGEETMITVVSGNHRLSFAGEIVYVEPGMGFAIKFQRVPEDELGQLLDLLKSIEASN